MSGLIDKGHTAYLDTGFGFHGALSRLKLVVGGVFARPRSIKTPGLEAAAGSKDLEGPRFDVGVGFHDVSSMGCRWWFYQARCRGWCSLPLQRAPPTISGIFSRITSSRTHFFGEAPRRRSLRRTRSGQEEGCKTGLKGLKTTPLSPMITGVRYRY